MRYSLRLAKVKDRCDFADGCQSWFSDLIRCLLPYLYDTKEEDGETSWMFLLASLMWMNLRIVSDISNTVGSAIPFPFTPQKSYLSPMVKHLDFRSPWIDFWQLNSGSWVLDKQEESSPESTSTTKSRLASGTRRLSYRGACVNNRSIYPMSGRVDGCLSFFSARRYGAWSSSRSSTRNS